MSITETMPNDFRDLKRRFKLISAWEDYADQIYRKVGDWRLNMSMGIGALENDAKWLVAPIRFTAKSAVGGSTQWVDGHG